MTGKPALTRKRNVPWVQGRYIPRNPAKYRGNPSNIIYRSSWERNFLRWCDSKREIVGWASEELVIPYQSPLDGKMHNYFVDFVVWALTRNGVQKYAVEIKPKAECRPPKPPRKRSLYESYRKRVETYEVNQAKWKYAKAWCEANGFKFLILTENELNKI